MSRARSSVWRGLVVCLTGLVAISIVAGCGSEDVAKQRSADVPADQAALDFAACVREQGVDMPDPGVAGAESAPPRETPDLSDPATRAALAICEKRSDRAGWTEEPGPYSSVPRRALEFAECMREQGIDFPDPVLDNGEVVYELSADANPDAPALRAANESCDRRAAESHAVSSNPDID